MWQYCKNLYHLKIAILANLLYGFPSRKLFVIGVTGTDGKTTTASLIYHILRTAGKKTIMVTTLGATINDQEFHTGLHVTTPSSFAIQRYLRQAVKSGCTHAVIEVSSHALDQNRVFGVKFSVGILTNISHEHLDYHKSIERYTRAKSKLLRNAKIALINKDDVSFPAVIRLLNNKKPLTYALKSADADFTLEKNPFTTRLLGEFNRYNCLAAFAATRTAGVDAESIRKAIASFKNPKGRQDLVYDKEFKIMIDFAVTPKAFENILSAVRAMQPRRILHVFGLSGRRDKEKRPIIGAIAAQYDDIIILTADDPRDESIESINDQIMTGIKGFTPVHEEDYTPKADNQKLLFEINDRRAAIHFAVKCAAHGDFVLLTGKGHEQSLALATGEVKWDEYEAVQEALVKRSI